MTHPVDEHSVFRTVPAKSLAKGDVTNDAARAIIRTEAEHQHAKTTRLREARLALEALLPPALPKTGARVSKPARKTRAVTTAEPQRGTL